MERVYVGNLPPDIRIKDIDDFFRPFGKLVYIDVNNRANPVFAYVQFDSARNAFNAVKARHGYDYEGYTLQLRLVENEVRKRRDATPPPPPPPMFSNYGSQNSNQFGGSFSNTVSSSFQSNSNTQWSNNSMSQQNQQQNISRSGNKRDMMDYPTNNRNNMQQRNMMAYSSSGGTNMQQQYFSSNMSQQQQYLNSNMSQQQQHLNSNMSQQQQYFNSNMSQQQQFNNSNRSFVSPQQQFFNSNQSNLSQQNVMNSKTNRLDKFQQQSMNNYSNANRSNMQQQNMNYSNNSSWNCGNNSENNIGNSGNNMGCGGGNNYNNAVPNLIYNANNDPYARPGFEDNFTRGLSGSGRKWFNRYIRKGFSPEMSRAKALEHRTVPYLREDPKIKNPIPDDTANAALETIGNTIISLLSTNPINNFNNDWGVDNFQGAGGPSTSRKAKMNPDKELGNMLSQSPGNRPQTNRVSKKQYLKSLGTLKNLRGKREQSAKDRISKKYHMQIVKDYERFENSTDSTRSYASRTTSSNPRNDRQIASKAAEGKTFMELSIALKNKKKQLFLEARRLRNDPNQSFGSAYKKRVRILMRDWGFPEIEAEALAVHPLEKLQALKSIKAEYDEASKKQPDPLLVKRRPRKRNAKGKAYRNDINYLKMYEKQNPDKFSPGLKTSLGACLARIHKHEKEAKMPLTKTKLEKLLSNTTGKNTTTHKKQDEKKDKTNINKTLAGNKRKPVKENNSVVEKKIENKMEVVEKNDKEEDIIVINDENDVVAEGDADPENGEENIAEGDEHVDFNEQQYEDVNEEEYEDGENPNYEENEDENPEN